MELLRCVAMLMVVGVHTNFVTLGVPTPNEAAQDAANAMTRFFFESLCIGAVNVFVLLSGWFGIKPSVRSLFKLFFQVLFFSFGIYVVMLALGLEVLSGENVRTALLLNGSYWFVPLYVGLYLLAPFVSAFFIRASRRQIELFLAVSFVLQCVWGLVSKDVSLFSGGYALFPFVLLYVAARYLRVYHASRIALHRAMFYMGCFLGIVLLQTFVSWVIKLHGLPGLWNIYYYTNPLVQLEALCLLCFFVRLRFRSRFVNWVAASSFSVYLIQDTPFVETHFFRPAIRNIYANMSNLSCFACIVVFVVATFVACILLDQLRIVCWRKIWSVSKKRIPQSLEDELATL